MSRRDVTIIGAIVAIALLAAVLIRVLGNTSSPKKANIYYKSDLVETVVLHGIDGTKTLEIKGANGPVIIEYKNGEIRVKEETSPLNICSKQGWTSSSLQPIVCVPNEVYIEIVADDSDIDIISG